MEHARSIVEIASLSGPAAAVLVSIIMCIWLLTALQKPMRDLAGGTTTASSGSKADRGVRQPGHLGNRACSWSGRASSCRMDGRLCWSGSLEQIRPATRVLRMRSTITEGVVGGGRAFDAARGRHGGEFRNGYG